MACSTEHAKLGKKKDHWLAVFMIINMMSIISGHGSGAKGFW